MTHIEIGCEAMDWINMSQDKDSVELLLTWCWKFAFIRLESGGFLDGEPLFSQEWLNFVVWDIIGFHYWDTFFNEMWMTVNVW